MAIVRRIHAALGVFAAPSVLFFAISGGLQAFDLHKYKGAYEPPALVEKLAEAHKNQHFALKPKRAAPAMAPSTERRETKERDAPSPTRWAAKWFVALIAAALTISACLGIWIALTQRRGRLLHAALLAIGAVLPVILFW